MVSDATGEAEQLSPEDLQVVGTEIQEPTLPGAPPFRIEQEEKREPPLPVAPRPAPSAVEVEEQQVAQAIFGVPVLKVNRYSGANQDWQSLVRWDIPEGRTGDLHEISLLSDNDTVTRYRIVIGNVDQELPTDRATSTPLDLKWQRGVLPGGTSVHVEVLSQTGVTIQVDGMIAGTVR